MGTPLGPKYIPYTHMNPLGLRVWDSGLVCNVTFGSRACSCVIGIASLAVASEEEAGFVGIRYGAVGLESLGMFGACRA